MRPETRWLPWLPLLVLLSGCSRSPLPIDDPLTGAARPVSAESRFEDWAVLDARFPRDLLTSVYMFHLLPDDDPLSRRDRGIRYTAQSDSLGCDDFLALAADERAERREAARDCRRRAMALRRVQRAWWHRVGENPGGIIPVGEAVEMTGDGVTETIGHLVNAVGLDPLDFSSWYDLAYLHGLVGDVRRQASAVEGGQRAVAAWRVLNGGRGEPPADLDAVERRLHLDRAWLLRDQGFFAECLESVSAAIAVMRLDQEKTPGEAREARVLYGLALAGAGRTVEARQVARSLEDRKLPRRQKWFVQGSDQGRVFDKRAFESVTSNFEQRWIRAVVFAKLQRGDQALAQFMDADYRTEFPPHLSYRFWNDVGAVREQFGEIADARSAYLQSAIARPLFVYYPMIGARGSARVYGQDGAGRLYFLGYKHHYLCGSFFSYAANRVVALELTRDPVRKRKHIDEALAALDACIRRDIRPLAARALRGRVRFRAGDERGAEEDLAAATAELRDLHRDEADALLILGVVRFNRRDYAAAADPLQRYVRLRPDEGIGWRLLGLALLHAGETDKALETMDEALRREPDSSVGLYNRGLLHLQAGRVDEARADLEAARRLWPGNAEIGRLLELAAGAAPPRIAIGHDAMDVEVSAADSTSLAAADLASPLQLVSGGGANDSAALGAEAARQLLPELRRRYQEDPTPEHRKAYAWGLLQADRPESVRRLLSGSWSAGMDREELLILLRADRALALPARAKHLAAGLDEGRTEPDDPAVWELVGAICMENSARREAVRALTHALELDPGNAALARLRDRLAGGR